MQCQHAQHCGSSPAVLQKTWLNLTDVFIIALKCANYNMINQSRLGIASEQQIVSHLSSHQMSHLSGGFIADVDGQLNSRENSRELEIVPITRNFAKLCGSLRILRWVASGRLLLHHTWTNNSQQLTTCKRQHKLLHCSLGTHNQLLGSFASISLTFSSSQVLSKSVT